MFVYCNTKDSPKTIGETLCKENFEDGKNWALNDEGEFFTITVNSASNCVAVIYSVSNLVVGIEIDENCSSKAIEPLIKNYGFENVKWLAYK
jgi:hypothetical protein